jgi:Rod binding domain-containing protein
MLASKIAEGGGLGLGPIISRQLTPAGSAATEENS